MSPFMKIAIEEACSGGVNNEGGPFGAVIVRNEEIISKAHNKVIKTNDPTAHAEIIAIRKASSALERFDLSDCEIYTSCEPCPMCLSAIHWAKIKNVYDGCAKEDIAKIGFDDHYIDNAIKGKVKEKRVKETQVERDECLKLFKLWELKTDKRQY